MAGPCITDTDTVQLSTPDGNTLQGDVKVSAVYDNAIQRNPDGLWVPGQQVTVALPTSPLVYDGQRVFRQLASGVMNELRYNAGSPNAQKWEQVGGPGLIVEDNSQVDYTTSGSPSGSWVDGGGSKLQLAAPLDAVYDIWCEVMSWISVGASTNVIQAGIGIAAADPGALTIIDNSTNGGKVSGRSTHRLFIAGGTQITLRYLNMAPTTTASWIRRKLGMNLIRAT